VRWQKDSNTSDIEDRRGDAPASGGDGLPVGALFSLFRWFGWPGVIIGALVIGGVVVAGKVTGGGSHKAIQGGPEEEQLKEFVTFVFNDIQKTWERQLPNYTHTKLVLFRGAVRSACGRASSAVGPFYCPGDNKVYIDLGFYDDLRRRFGAPGDFAQAYVIAHEVGHHIQNLLGQFHGGNDRDESIRTELQADCLAGAWGMDANRRDILEMGDFDEAITAATAIGDDTLQRKATGHVQPEKWTHGSSAQRSASFRKGFEGGAKACGI
jgi:uncharacterized protein